MGQLSKRKSSFNWKIFQLKNRDVNENRDLQDQRWQFLLRCSGKRKAHRLANKAHGLRRTNEEKQEAVKHALLHPQAKGMSDRKIAEHVGVHHSTSADWRKKLEPSDEGRTDSEEVGEIPQLKNGDVNENRNLQRQELEAGSEIPKVTARQRKDG